MMTTTDDEDDDVSDNDQIGLREAIRAAREALEEVRGRPVDGVVGADRHEDGFTVSLEVVELERVPRSTDVVAVYDVELDTDGELVSYRRVARATRADVGEELS